MNQLKANSTYNLFISFIIITLSVSPAFALGEGNRNLFLIAVMMLSPIALLFLKNFVLQKTDIPLICLCLMMICFPMLNHPETLRWSTILYTCLFCMYFMVFTRFVNTNCYKLQYLSELMKQLIYAYSIVLIIQQFCVLTGLPIFNVSNYSIYEPWKLNSLMSEPSHSARIIPVLMYFYICCQLKLSDSFTVKGNIKDNPKVWAAFMWCICTMGSTTAFIFLFIILMKMIDKKRFIQSFVIVGCIVCYMFFVSENKSIVRMRKLAVATLTLNEETILMAGGSGAYRIVPTIQGAKKIGITSMDDWFGHGVDADLKAIKPLPGATVGNAGTFHLWYNYGFPVAVIWWLFSFFTCRIKGDMVSILIWLLCVFMYGGLNSQIIWMVLAISFIYKHLTY